MSVPWSELPPEVQQGILDMPAVLPPGDTKPNFTNPSHQDTAPRVILGFFLALNTILVLLRLYGRFKLRKFTFVDFLIGATYALFVAFAAILLDLISEHHSFVHTWDIQAKNTPPIIYSTLNSICLYAVTLGAIKVAILLEWLDIFGPAHTTNFFFWCAHILLWINALFYFAAIIVLNVSCNPREKYWMRWLDGHCIDDIPLDITSAIVNLVVDIGILLLPQRVIWKLNLTPKNRRGVSAIFGLGIIAVAAATYRTAFTIQKQHSVDTTWDYSLISLLLTLEISCGFLVVCLPVCPKALHALGAVQLYSRIRSTFTGMTSRGSGGQESQRYGSNSSWPRLRHKTSNTSGNPDVPDGQFVPLEPWGSNRELTKGPKTPSSRSKHSTEV